MVRRGHRSTDHGLPLPQHSQHRQDRARRIALFAAGDPKDRPVEVRSLARWFEEITNGHKAFLSNGPTEAVNDLIKRIKQIGFGFRSFTHYRIRVSLYAGRPNWDLLPTVIPR